MVLLSGIVVAVSERQMKERHEKHSDGNVGGIRAWTTALLRWRVSTALEVLGTLAHVADEGLEATHGGAQRRRGASTPARWGNGLSEQAKNASAIYACPHSAYDWASPSGRYVAG